jgi:integrase
VTLPEQEKYIEQRRRERVSDSTISRELSVLRAALNRAHRRGMLANPIPVMGLGASPERERVMTPAEVAALLDAATATHLRTFLVLAINTAARPDAILGLSRPQVDLSAGFINLNPAGRKQTKKRRPTLPITDSLRPWLEGLSGDPAYVLYKGRPVGAIKTAFREARRTAGLDDDVIPYTLRHTIASEMRRRGVSPWEVAAWLGHRIAEFSTTERYAKYGPDYLAGARQAIDSYVAELVAQGADLGFRASFAQNPVSRKGVTSP